MNIQNILRELSNELKGHNALIQIQVDGQYVIKHIGDVNKLVDNPTLIAYKEDSSFLDWMEEDIDKETYAAGTIANHKAALAVLRRFKEGMTFTQIDYKSKVSHPSISWVFQPNCFANTHEREPLTHV